MPRPQIYQPPSNSDFPWPAYIFFGIVFVIIAVIFWMIMPFIMLIDWAGNHVQNFDKKWWFSAFIGLAVAVVFGIIIAISATNN